MSKQTGNASLVIVLVVIILILISVGILIGPHAYKLLKFDALTPSSRLEYVNKKPQTVELKNQDSYNQLPGNSFQNITFKTSFGSVTDRQEKATPSAQLRLRFDSGVTMSVLIPKFASFMTLNDVQSDLSLLAAHQNTNELDYDLTQKVLETTPSDLNLLKFGNDFDLSYRLLTLKQLELVKDSYIITAPSLKAIQYDNPANLTSEDVIRVRIWPNQGSYLELLLTGVKSEQDIYPILATMSFK